MSYVTPMGEVKSEGQVQRELKYQNELARGDAKAIAASEEDLRRAFPMSLVLPENQPRSSAAAPAGGGSKLMWLGLAALGLFAVTRK